MLKANEAYCIGCGKPKPIVYQSIDGRYPIVQCGRVRREGTMVRAKARAVIKERRLRRKAMKAAAAFQTTTFE